MENNEITATIAALLNAAAADVTGLGAGLTEAAMAMEGGNQNMAFGILLEAQELLDRAQARLAAARTIRDL
ncbi:hypothetical protein [Ruegeria sp. PrR005]|uniref:Uncharacterized protein n=1 Tax=Ruegeria sp. PrR005 TaxID=2706882 RepID=A0A6B2NHR1_9RHOB|nr:hypothetical protein [Ruegeria sp. PrR005]NDW43712.1 hypothetical protein [Ruegeria sp. PrR005]